MSDGAAIPTSTPIFSAMANSDMTLSTLSDIARHCQTLTRYKKIKMAATETGNGNNY